MLYSLNYRHILFNKFRGKTQSRDIGDFLYLCNNHKSMKKIFIVSLCILIFSCFKTEIVQMEVAYDPEIDGFYDGQHFFRQRNYSRPCYYPYNFVSGFNCKFLSKYDETIWEDAENYYSNFSDIRFLNKPNNFISFFNIDNDVSYCKGWKAGENSADGKRWSIKFKKDEEDILSFDYDYFGKGDEIEYSITYTYEVIDGLLHFSRTKIEKNNSKDVADTGEIDQTFIFSPSEKNYLKDVVDTGEIIVSEGCMFY